MSLAEHNLSAKLHTVAGALAKGSCFAARAPPPYTHAPHTPPCAHINAHKRLTYTLTY